MTAATRRGQLIDLYCAAVAGANLESRTADAVASLALQGRHRVWVFAFGKAAHAMAAGAVGTLQRALAEIAGGIVVAPEAAAPPCGTVSVVVGDHPVPGPRSFAAAARVEEVLARKRGADLGLVLLSGGASSLIASPLRGLNETDLSRVYELLLTSGLGIHETNAIRKRFGLLAAGRMALALAPAQTVCFAASDVTDDDLATIGSGPCVPDPTRVQRVIDLLRENHLLLRIASAYQTYLFDVARGAIPETPKESHPAFAHVHARVVANNRLALTAAAAAAQRFGFSTVVHDEPLVGAAADAGARVADAMMAARDLGHGQTCVVWGGETTVAVTDPAPRGGRCQELALAAARRLADAGERGRGISILAAGTDGRDGTTDVAGAVVDADTWSAIAAAGFDPARALRDHVTHDALAATSAVFAPGLTGTNVMDVTIGLMQL